MFPFRSVTNLARLQRNSTNISFDSKFTCRTNTSLIMVASLLLVHTVSIRADMSESMRDNSEPLTLEAKYIPPTQVAYSLRTTQDQFDLSERHHLNISLPSLIQGNEGSVRSRSKGGPYKVGIHRDLPKIHKGNLVNRIRWQSNVDGFAGVVKIDSPGAQSMRISLSAKLPLGSTVILYELDDFGIGNEPITLSNEFSSTLTLSKWLPTVQGSRAALWISVPTIDDVHIKVNQISHGVERLDDSSSFELDGCQNHRNASCIENEDRYAESATTLMLLFEKEDGSYICSGVQMNDKTEDSHIPYILTAEHCINDQDTADTLEVLAYFRYTDCNTKQLDNEFRINSSGAYLLETVPQQDMSLLRLKNAKGASGWFAGWSFNSEHIDVESDIYSYHHPLGQEQKFAEGTIGRLSDVNSCDDEGDCDLIRNAIIAEWRDGVTEGGSSGSGVFAEERYLVGVLSSAPDGCEDSESYYGSLNRSGRSISKWLAAEDNDDHGNEEESATLIRRTDIVRGVLEKPNDADYFQLDVHHHGELITYTTGDVDTYGTLIGEEIFRSNDDSGDGSNFRLTQDLEVGQYYIRVKPFSSTSGVGSYRLYTEFNLADIGDTWEKSYRLSETTNFLESALETEGDEDWFVIRLSDKGTLRVFTTGSTDTHCGILPAIDSGLTNRFDDDSGSMQNCSLEMSVFPHYFYIRVRGSDDSDTGDYGIFINFTHSDDHANDTTNATEVFTSSDNWSFSTTAHMGFRRYGCIPYHTRLRW